MDIRKVKKLIELMEESSVGELEIREGEEHVRIARNSPVAMGPCTADLRAATSDRGASGAGGRC